MISYSSPTSKLSPIALTISCPPQVLAAVDAMRQAALGGPGVGAGRTAEEEALMLEEVPEDKESEIAEGTPSPTSL